MTEAADERAGRIWELRTRNARDRADMAERRERREFNDIITKPQPLSQLIFKTKHDALIERDFEIDGDENDPLLVLADEIGIYTGRLQRELGELRRRVEELEAKR